MASQGAASETDGRLVDAAPLPTLRLPSWQRALRHLRHVQLVGLPFEPASSGHLSIELLPLPSSAVRVRLRLRAEHGGVGALLMVVEDAQDATPPALAGRTLCSPASVPCSTHPQWQIRSEELPDGAGALRGAVVVVKQAEPRGGATKAGAVRTVWQRPVRFAELALVVAQDATALRRLLPPTGLLLLSFVDGICAAAQDLSALTEAGLLERCLLYTSPSPRDS